jgi:hypothetical protein
MESVGGLKTCRGVNLSVGETHTNLGAPAGRRAEVVTDNPGRKTQRIGSVQHPAQGLWVFFPSLVLRDSIPKMHGSR